MAAVLTESSTLACGDAGSLKLNAGQSKLTINGNKVLVQGDLDGATVERCPTPDNANPPSKKCTLVSSTIGGVAGKLTVDGKGVLLESIQGLTDGLVGPKIGTWSVQSAGQTKLTTV
jgi:hypothetical protein